MKQLTTRQSCFMLFAVTSAMKLLVLPSLLIEQSQNAVWLVLLVMFLIDATALLLVFSLMKAFPEKTFSELMETALGKVCSKIVLCVLGILFALKVAMLARECYEFYAETAYVDFSYLVYLVPLVLILGYLSTRQIRVLGRSVEIFMYFIVLSIIMAILFSVSSLDIFAIMPLLPNGISPVAKSCFDYAFWFGDFLIVLFYLGNVKYEKQSLNKLFMAYSLAMMVVSVITIIHYSLFGIISSSYKTSIVDITEYIPRITNSGRFTWLIILFWPIAMLYAMAVYCKMSVHCFSKTFEVAEKGNRLLSYSVVALSLCFLISTFFSQNLMIDVITKYLKYGVFAVQVGIPLLIPLVLVKNLKKEQLESEKDIQK